MSNTNYIISTRNPRTAKLILITEEDSELVAEFDTEHDAIRAACHIPICQAWGYELIEVSAPVRNVTQAIG